MGRPVSYERAVAWKVLNDEQNAHCICFMFVNWSFVWHYVRSYRYQCVKDEDLLQDIYAVLFFCFCTFTGFVLKTWICICYVTICVKPMLLLFLLHSPPNILLLEIGCGINFYQCFDTDFWGIKLAYRR